MNAPKKAILHATAVAIGGVAVLLRGASGTGKSDLAFRLVEGHGARLVCDDQTECAVRHGRVYASPAPHITGFMEVRGIGLVKYDASHAVPLALVADLVPRDQVRRLPARETAAVLGVDIPRIALHAFDASAPLKVLKALEIAARPGLLVE